MKNWTAKDLLKDPGLYFDGHSFGSDFDRDEPNRILTALSGSSQDSGKTVLKARIREKVLELFQICVRYGPVFVALKDKYSEVFAMVAKEWKTYNPLSSLDVETVVRRYMFARQMYRGQQSSKTDLTQLIDEFRVTWDELQRLVVQDTPINQSTLAVRPEPSAAMANDFQSLNMVTPELQREQSWPPSVFTDTEKRFFEDVQIRQDLTGINKTNQQVSTTPSIATDAIDIKKHLCQFALSHECHGGFGTFALYMEPIAFHTTADRNRAYFSAASSPKKYGTLDNFVRFGKEVTRFRDTILGLVTDMSHRTALAIVIRPLDRYTVAPRQMQVLVVDPYLPVQEDEDLALMWDDFRVGIANMLSDFPDVVEFWWGGSELMRDLATEDALEGSCKVVHEVITNAEFLNFGENERVDGMRKLGFWRTNVSRRTSQHE
ncbi:hypothetical protein SUNI508_01045 [Seiridium unicorne]|uniref:Uncharacterized protein n=1 Tax=Seiridium unicorne TaxID=138068 RepID=A0ABR2UXB5_9PEZI